MAALIDTLIEPEFIFQENKDWNFSSSCIGDSTPYRLNSYSRKTRIETKIGRWNEMEIFAPEFIFQENKDWNYTERRGQNKIETLPEFIFQENKDWNSKKQKKADPGGRAWIHIPGKQGLKHFKEFAHVFYFRLPEFIFQENKDWNYIDSRPGAIETAGLNSYSRKTRIETSRNDRWDNWWH